MQPFYSLANQSRFAILYIHTAKGMRHEFPRVSLVDTLTEQGRIWTARDARETTVAAISSGYAELDALLPGHGWPLGAVTEILYPELGCGELRLLLPALARSSQQDERWQLWLNAPLPPCVPALQHWGFNTQRLLLAHTSRPVDVCHSLEKSLQSGGCQAAVVWLTQLDKALMRRIQLAAESARVAVFMLRPSQFQNQPSVASLRLAINPQGRINIIKRRAGWPVSDLQISLPLNRVGC
jgi:protein ImuA